MKAPYDGHAKEITDLAKLRRLEKKAKSRAEKDPSEALEAKTPKSEAEKAYDIAVEWIKAAQRNGEIELSFDTEETHALTDIPSEIAMLDDLTTLWLNNTSVSDLSPLSGLSSLSHLRLNGTFVKNLTPLSGLSTLSTLLLNQTSVTDLSPLSGLSALSFLNLNDTLVSDLVPLSRLRRLSGLLLSSTPVSDLTPLSGLNALSILWLDDTKVNGLSPLSGLSGLEYLLLRNTKVKDLTAMSGLPLLREVRLDGSQVVDLRPLVHMRDVKLEDFDEGVTFQDTPATQVDTRLAEIAEIDDDATRLKTLFDYLDDWEVPGEEPVHSGTTLPSVPDATQAPIQVELSNGRLHRLASEGLPEADERALAQAGWQALKTFRDTFGAGFVLHNYPQLMSFLTAFDQAMGDRYDPSKVVMIGSMGSAIAALARDREFTDCLPIGASPLLEQFAVQIDVYLNRFPDWRRYQAMAKAMDVTSQDVHRDAVEFREIEAEVVASEDVDADVKQDVEVVMEAALGDVASDEAAKGLVASTQEIVRAASEELVSGRAVRDVVADMDGVHDTEVAKWKWRVGGFAVVFLKRRQEALRVLAQNYPKQLGWVPAVLDWAFGPGDQTPDK